MTESRQNYMEYTDIFKEIIRWRVQERRVLWFVCDVPRAPWLNELFIKPGSAGYLPVRLW